MWWEITGRHGGKPGEGPGKAGGYHGVSAAVGFAVSCNCAHAHNITPARAPTRTRKRHELHVACHGSVRAVACHCNDIMDSRCFTWDAVVLSLERRSLNRLKAGSIPLAVIPKLGQFRSLYIASIHSAL